LFEKKFEKKNFEMNGLQKIREKWTEGKLSSSWSFDVFKRFLLSNKNFFLKKNPFKKICCSTSSNHKEEGKKKKKT